MNQTILELMKDHFNKQISKDVFFRNGALNESIIKDLKKHNAAFSWFNEELGIVEYFDSKGNVL
jgi:hypothetical protein